MKLTWFSYSFSTVLALAQICVAQEHDTKAQNENSDIAIQSSATKNPETQKTDTEQNAPLLEEVFIFGSRYDGYRSHQTMSATRSLTPIEEIPQSISVITGKLINDQQPISIGETLRNISGIVINHSMLTPAFDNTLIRGFAAEQFVDGFTQYYNPGDRDSLINVARIEVLKGTNGLLYGGGSGTPIGGMVNIVSKMPEAKSSAELAFKAGSNQFAQTAFDINEGLSERLFARLTAEYTESETDIEHLDSKRYNINPALRFQINESGDMLIRFKHSRWRGQDYQGLPAYGTVLGELKIDPWLFIGNEDIDRSRSDFDALEIKTNYALNSNWQAIGQMRVARSEFEQNVQVISGGGFDFGVDLPIIGPPALAQSLGLGQLPFALYNAQLAQKQDEISLVGNLIYSIEQTHWRQTWLFGADYSQYDDQGYIDFSVVGQDFIIDLANPDFTTAFEVPGPAIIDNFVDNTVYGLYSQWQASYKESLHLLLGLRYGSVEIDFRSPDNDDSTDKQRVIPRAGVVFDINDSFSAFAGFSEGMRGQAFADFVTEPAPEQSRQYEIGAKFKVNNWLSGQVAWFDIKRSNVAVPTPNPNRDGGFGVIPQGEQSSQGVDMELLWRPFDGFNIWGSYSVIETRFNDDLFAFADGDDELPGVPEQSGRLWLNYQFQSGWLKGLRLGAGMYAQTASLISLRNEFYADDYTVYDASAAYDFGAHKVELSIKNLTDHFYYDRLNYLGGRVAPGQRRAAYLTWRYELY